MAKGGGGLGSVGGSEGYGRAILGIMGGGRSDAWLLATVVFFAPCFLAESYLCTILLISIRSMLFAYSSPLNP